MHTENSTNRVELPKATINKCGFLSSTEGEQTVRFHNPADTKAAPSAPIVNLEKLEVQNG